jgi:hypothetical protein
LTPKAKARENKHKGSQELTTQIRVGKRRKKRTYNKALALVGVGSS